MKIGILETGLIREALADRFEPYPIMFADFLGLSERGLEYDSYSVVRGEMPPSITACDGWLITGSRHGVYDQLDWMAPLQAFIRQLADAHIPLIGICFGHQIIAQALGGNVVKSDKGWGVGVHHYRIDSHREWMGDAPETLKMYVFHQDQIVTLPPTAEVFASNDFCPYAGLSYADSIISVQGHPEFQSTYMTALLDTYGGSIVPEAIAAAARDSMRDAADTRLLADWCNEFFLSRNAAGAVPVDQAG